MVAAIAEARLAPAHGDVPIGAVVVAGGEIVARRHNERERLGDPTAHAEILALRDAAVVIGAGWRLDGATLVVTLEPCPMCAGALVAARVGRVVFGAADPKAGACGSLYNLCADPRLNHEVEVVPGVSEDETAALLSEFFADQTPRLGSSVRRVARADEWGGLESRCGLRFTVGSNPTPSATTTSCWSEATGTHLNGRSPLDSLLPSGTP